jgi:hypothetical protein
MSRNGSGTYTLPAGNPVVTGTTISSTWSNNTLTDIATALTGSLASDGQTTATGNLKLGSNRITGMADGIASTDAATVSQVTTAIAGLGTMSAQNANAVAVTGGTVNGATVGATTAASGRFTTLEVTTTSTFTGDGSFNGTGALKVPVGTTAQQPTPATGQIRYNTTNNQYEGYGASAWAALGAGAAGSNTQVQFNSSGSLAGSSGLTFNGTILQATTLQTATLNSTSGVLATQNGMTGIATAWVSYNGTAGTISSSFNVGSVTKNSAGNYTINFTTAMPNANYAAVFGGNSPSYIAVFDNSAARTTTALNLITINIVGTTADTTQVNVSVFST